AFVLATGTATGHAVASAAGIPGLRVTYSPLDFPFMVARYLKRFQPSQIVLIEAEVWPHFMRACHQRAIPVSLANARMSPRSARRMTRFAKHLRPFYSLLANVGIQQPEDREIWLNLGVTPANIHLTGSVKFDPGSGTLPAKHPEFQHILDTFGPSRPVVLAASTHAGEDAPIATAIRTAAPHALPVIVPRHAERRSEVKSALEQAGFSVTLRSSFTPQTQPGDILVIDTTGELRDWTAHANVVIIGKSFLSTGGQNPCEAILARVPVIFGPHMENFEPLATRLVETHAAIRTTGTADLATAIQSALDPETAGKQTTNATAILTPHRGATTKTLELLS
ncbi:MAG: 3-deoxy-D-manno-octulosonic acid transferase, partial [Verrucomicrobiales bacterium]